VYAIASTQAALATGLTREPSGDEPIPAKTGKPRLSGLTVRTGYEGRVFSWQSINELTWQTLVLVSGGKGIASAVAYVKCPEYENDAATLQWAEYSCIAHKPTGGFGEVFGERVGAQMRLTKLVRLGAAS